MGQRESHSEGPDCNYGHGRGLGSEWELERKYENVAKVTSEQDPSSGTRDGWATLSCVVKGDLPAVGGQLRVQARFSSLSHGGATQGGPKGKETPRP